MDRKRRTERGYRRQDQEYRSGGSGGYSSRNEGRSVGGGPEFKRPKHQPHHQTHQNQTHQTPQQKSSGGLNVQLHPFLKDIVPLPKASSRPIDLKARKQFDPSSINPYLDQLNISIGRKNRSRALQFNAPGKYIEQADKLREQLRKEQAHTNQLRSLQQKGLVPNKDIGEHLYTQPHPPGIEWWDSYYINGHDYDLINDSSNIILDNEITPITKYIQHPILTIAPFEKHSTPAKPMYLTKKEMKRKRKNERQERFRIQQERIRQGLEPPPPPKVKLSNLMSVLTNEAIKDPTSIEKKVKHQVDQRFKAHMKANEDRKLSKPQKQEKLHEKRQQDLSKGFFRTIYRIDQLVDSQHFFKVDKNAQQLELAGLCIVTDKMTMIIVEGGAKSIKFYDKLMMRRIDWTKSNNEAINLESNRVVKVWEGQVKDLQFQRWSILKIKNDQDLDSVLNRFSIDSYWRQAINV